MLRAEAAAKREAAKKERERAKAEHLAHKHNKVFLPGTKVISPESSVSYHSFARSFNDLVFFMTSMSRMRVD